MKEHKFMNFKHINTSEVYYIANFLSLELSLRIIIKYLNRNISIISSEVKRYSSNSDYLAYIVY